MTNTPVPADPTDSDLPGDPAPVELPMPTGQQPDPADDPTERRNNASRRVEADPRT